MQSSFAIATNADKTLQQSTSVIKQITNSLFGGNSIWVLLLSLLAAWVIGKLCSAILRNVSRIFGRNADAATNLVAVTRFRRLETWTILSIAIVRLLLFILGLFFWWTFTHPGSQPSALAGASAVLIVVIGGVISPLLRDFAFGSGMMAEHWFGVGDLITVIPFPDVQGVVERITLRSTRIRGLNGEVIWMANQNIQGVRIAQKGVWSMAIEMFVNDPEGAEDLIDDVNDLLPIGPSLIATRLGIMASTQRSKDLWHITAIAETAPGREWLIRETAIDLLKRLDEKSRKPVLMADPVARYADNDTERQFARAVSNAKKIRRKPRLIKIVKEKEGERKKKKAAGSAS
jgi:hypothetical protein